jgi:hypothetical protein
MPEHNERQYRLILGQLTRFENGQLALDALVDNLDGLLNALERISTSWKQTFLQEWGKLEDERSYASFKNIRAFDQETTQRIRAAVSRLKLLVLEQIEHPSDRRRNYP